MASNTELLTENVVTSSPAVKIGSAKIAAQINGRMTDSDQMTGDRSSRTDTPNYPETQRSIINSAGESRGRMRNADRTCDTYNGQIPQTGATGNFQLAGNPQHNAVSNDLARNYNNQIGIGAKQKSSDQHDKRVYREAHGLDTDASPFSISTENEGGCNLSRGPLQQTVNIEEIKRTYGPHEYLDATVVYAKDDYDDVVQNFIPWLEDVCALQNPRICLYDDDIFPPHNIESIGYIIDKSMRVLVYLTKNFSKERNNKFLTSEAISNTRLVNPFEVTSQVIKSQRKWAVRPVHTQPEERRYYKTPIGLTSVRGIEFCYKERSHTQEKAKMLICEAICDRKKREEEEANKSSSNSTGSTGASNFGYNDQRIVPTCTVSAALTPSGASASCVSHSNSGQSMPLGVNGIDNKKSRVLTNKTERIDIPPDHSRDNSLPESQVAQNVWRQEGPENLSLQPENSSIAKSVTDQGGTGGIFVYGHSPPSNASQLAGQFHTENSSENRTSAADPEGTDYNNDEMASQQSQVQAYVELQPSDKNDQGSGVTETDGHRTENIAVNREDTQPEDIHDKSLEVDAKPSLISKDEATFAKGIKAQNSHENYGEVIENVMSYHGQPERRVPPCASAPMNNVAQNNSNKRKKHAERIVIKEFHHYYERDEPPQINIVGCGVVQIGNDTTVANTNVSTSNSDSSNRKFEETDTKVKDGQRTERTESSDSLPSDVSHDNAPSNVSEDHGTGKSGGQGIKEEDDRPSLNILSPEPVKNITSQDFTNRANSFNIENEVKSSSEGESDEDNSLQASNNADETETKDILDDMLLTTGLDVPSNWTPTKPGSDKSQLLDNQSLTHSDVQDDKNLRLDSNTTEVDIEKKKQSSLSKSSESSTDTQSNCNTQHSIPDNLHEPSSKQGDISNNNLKDDSAQGESFSATQISVNLSSDGYSLCSSKSEPAISVCVDVKSFGERRRCKTCPIKLLRSSCSNSSTPDFSRTEIAQETTDELD